MRKLITFTAAILCLTLLASCDQKRRSGSVGDGSSDSENGASADGSRVELNALPKHGGKVPDNTDLADTDASSSLPGSSWADDPSSKGGMFLVAAASVPNSAGGDFIRRIDLEGTPKEFDYDPDKPGAQGAYIYVPDEFKEWVTSGLVDGESLFKGSICAFIPGPNKQVIALSLGDGNDSAVGFLIDPYEKAMAFTPKEVYRFPMAHNPVSAFYSKDLGKLYVVDVAATSFKNANEGIYAVDVGTGSKNADYYPIPNEKRPNSHSVANFTSINMYKGTLYLVSGNARFDNDWDTGVYRVPLNTDGEPLIDKLTFARANNPIMRVPNCALSSTNIAASIIVDGSTPILLSGGTEALVAWDISGDTPTKIDLNDKMPGVQPQVKFAHNGLGVPAMSYDPAGKNIYALHHCRSSEKFTVKGNDRSVFNVSKINPKDLKAQPEGVDMAYRKFLESLKSNYNPNFTMTTRSFAVGTHHIGVVGSSGSNISGLGAGSDVTIISLKDGSPIAFEKPEDVKTAHTQHYGFKLAKGDKNFDRLEQNGRAIVWLP